MVQYCPCCGGAGAWSDNAAGTHIRGSMEKEQNLADTTTKDRSDGPNYRTVQTSVLGKELYGIVDWDTGTCFVTAPSLDDLRNRLQRMVGAFAKSPVVDHDAGESIKAFNARTTNKFDTPVR